MESKEVLRHQHSAEGPHAPLDCPRSQQSAGGDSRKDQVEWNVQRIRASECKPGPTAMTAPAA